MKWVSGAFGLFLWRNGAKTGRDEGHHRAIGGRQVGRALRSVGEAFYSAALGKRPGHDRDQEQKSPFQLRAAARREGPSQLLNENLRDRIVKSFGHAKILFRRRDTTIEAHVGFPALVLAVTQFEQRIDHRLDDLFNRQRGGISFAAETCKHAEAQFAELFDATCKNLPEKLFLALEIVMIQAEACLRQLSHFADRYRIEFMLSEQGFGSVKQPFARRRRRDTGLFCRHRHRSLVQQRTVPAKAQIRAVLKSAFAPVGTSRCPFPQSQRPGAPRIEGPATRRGTTTKAVSQ